MKNAIFVLLSMMTVTIFANAETYSACYTEARRNLYNLKDAAKLCRGLVSDTCYNDARKNLFNMVDSATICRNVVSDVCYSETRKTFFLSVVDAAKMCRGLVDSTCYIDARRNAMTVKDAVELCRATVICQPSEN